MTSNISFYGSAFYSNRRGNFYNPGNLGPSAFNAMNNVTIPTFNPYYPTGAPSGLRAAYNISIESPGITSFYELAQRYQLGLNISLPAGWSGRVYYAHTRDANFNIVRGDVNKAAVSAALGWTIATTPASGTTPAIGTWTKPSSVPYLNLLCDPTRFQCNSEKTLTYMQGLRNFDQRFHVNEKGGVFDGPLFDIPGGVVKAAVGATYTTFIDSTTTIDNTNAPTLLAPSAGLEQASGLGGLHPNQHSRIQRAERAAAAAPRRPRILLAARPVQRRGWDLQSQGRVQLGADRRLADPRHVG